MSRKRLPLGERIFNDFSDFLYKIISIFFSIMVLGLLGWTYLNPDKAKFYSYIALVAVIILGIVAVVIIILLGKRKKRPSALQSEEDILYMLKGMPWDKFEEKVATIFSNLEYQNVNLVGGTGDHGIDIKMKKDGKDYFIQCKHYLNKVVGEPYIRDFYGAITGGYAEKGFFIIMSDFTNQAMQFAKEHPRIELINGRKLAELYKIAQGDAR